MTISKNQEKSKKSHFFGLRKIISRKTRFFQNQNRCRYEILVKTKIFSFLCDDLKKTREIEKKSFFRPTDNY